MAPPTPSAPIHHLGERARGRGGGAEPPLLRTLPSPPLPTASKWYGLAVLCKHRVKGTGPLLKGPRPAEGEQGAEPASTRLRGGGVGSAKGPGRSLSGGGEGGVSGSRSPEGLDHCMGF